MEKIRSSFQAIKFLNANAYKMFDNQQTYGVNISRFKKNMLFALNAIENTFTGTFHSDLFVLKVDPKRFEKLYPNAYLLFNSDMSAVARFLDNVRNCCAHARSSRSDLEVFNTRFNTLVNQPIFNNEVQYCVAGKLTIAGLVFIIFNFLRKETIEKVCKEDVMFGLIACGRPERNDGSKFVNAISHVDLESHPIRTISGSDFKTALLGSYASCLKDNGEFELPTRNLIYGASGKIVDNSITINADSKTYTYYPSDYQVDVKYVEGFIELANQLPELLIIDVCKEMDIHVFDYSAYQSIKAKWPLISKMNYPKYYEDKNIKTIFVPQTVADYRVINSILNSGVSSICLALEKAVTKEYPVGKKDYSHFRWAIENIIDNEQLVNSLVALRNFAMHGRPWGDFQNIGNKIYYYSPEFVFDTLALFLKEKNRLDNKVYEKSSYEIQKDLIERICSYRYLQVNKLSQEILNSYPRKVGMDEYAKKILYVDRSMFDIEELDELNKLNDEITYEYKVYLPHIDLPIYMEASEEADILLNDICKKNNLQRFDEGGLTLAIIRLK